MWPLHVQHVYGFVPTIGCADDRVSPPTASASSSSPTRQDQRVQAISAEAEIEAMPRSEIVVHERDGVGATECVDIFDVVTLTMLLPLARLSVSPNPKLISMSMLLVITQPY